MWENVYLATPGFNLSVGVECRLRTLRQCVLIKPIKCIVSVYVQSSKAMDKTASKVECKNRMCLVEYANVHPPTFLKGDNTDPLSFISIQTIGLIKRINVKWQYGIRITFF